MIEREKKEWGVRLVLKPLTDRPDMRVIAEITKPKPGRTPDIRFWFDGVPSDSPMRTTDLIVWNQAVRQFLDSVKEESVKVGTNVVSRKK
jgi:hypothetical protein